MCGCCLLCGCCCCYYEWCGFGSGVCFSFTRCVCVPGSGVCTWYKVCVCTWYKVCVCTWYKVCVYLVQVVVGLSLLAKEHSLVVVWKSCQHLIEDVVVPL